MTSTLALPAPAAPALWRRAARLPYWRTVLAIFGVYALYLPFSGYRGLHYDALNYWFLSIFFHKQGTISLFNYNDSLRGYLYPLTLFPWRVIQYYTDAPQLVFARLLGAVSAAVGFGWVGPKAWEAVTGRGPLPWGRRALFAGLGLLFWRDYFNFTLTDFPALWSLGTAIWLLYRPRNLYAVLGAGVCLAAATNFRPIYLAAAPFVAALVWAAPAAAGQQRWRRAGAFAAGLALVMLPQFVINVRHFQRPTPLVLARDLNVGELYLTQLQLGLDFQKYETNVGPDYPSPRMFFLDPHGRQLLNAFPNREIRSYEQYVRALLLRRPVAMARVYLTHLFNGLDVHYASPYILRVYKNTLGLAWLNYTLWFAALVLAVRGGRPTWRGVLVLAALVVPCVAVLPVCIECRYLLPLHLLLYAVVCFGWPAAWQPQIGSRVRAMALAVTYMVFLGLCFWASASAQATLEWGARSLW